jgi:hypothetical protein
MEPVRVPAKTAAGCPGTLLVMRDTWAMHDESNAGHRFCFTLDTEPDNLWANAPTLGFEHVSRLLDFHKDLVEAGARPTYLTTSEMAEHAVSRRVMEGILDHGSAEIGVHFHTWTRSWPFPVPDLGVPPMHACAHHLGQEVEEQMLEHTCRVLESALGSRPVSHRGGRWSLSGRSLTSLRNCGISVDSTVTPGISWANARHPWLSAPDFRTATRTPYYMAEESLEPRTHGDILELPIGASFIPDRRRALSQSFHHRLARKLHRSMRRPYGLVWLRPTEQSRAEMRKCLQLLRRDGVSVWVAMVHSSEIMPCKRLPSEPEVARFRQRCIALVRDALELGAVPATLREAWEHCESRVRVRGPH